MEALAKRRAAGAGRGRVVPAPAGPRPEDGSPDLARARRHDARGAEGGRRGASGCRALAGLGARHRGEDPQGARRGPGTRTSRDAGCSARGCRSCARSSRRCGRIPSAIDVSEAGSTRRRRETFRDLDVIATATDPPALTAHFVGLPWVLEVVAHGDTKATVINKRRPPARSPRRSPGVLRRSAPALHRLEGPQRRAARGRPARRALGLRVRRHGRRDGRGARRSATRRRSTPSSATRTSRPSCARTAASSRRRGRGRCRTARRARRPARRDALPLDVVGRRQGDDRGDGARRRGPRLRVPLPDRPLALPPRRADRGAVGRDRRGQRAARRRSGSCAAIEANITRQGRRRRRRTTCSRSSTGSWPRCTRRSTGARPSACSPRSTTRTSTASATSRAAGSRVVRGADLDLERVVAPRGRDRHGARDQRAARPARHARRPRAPRRRGRRARSR